MDYETLFTAGFAIFAAIGAGTVAALIAYAKTKADVKVEIERTVDAQLDHFRRRRRV